MRSVFTLRPDFRVNSCGAFSVEGEITFRLVSSCRLAQGLSWMRPSYSGR
jgi:hypothetical protein